VGALFQKSLISGKGYKTNKNSLDKQIATSSTAPETGQEKARVVFGCTWPNCAKAKTRPKYRVRRSGENEECNNQGKVHRATGWGGGGGGGVVCGGGGGGGLFGKDKNVRGMEINIESCSS